MLGSAGLGLAGDDIMVLNAVVPNDKRSVKAMNMLCSIILVQQLLLYLSVCSGGRQVNLHI